jgi:hypothetical protein
VTRRAPVVTTARPSPGKTYALFVCDGANRRPSSTTGSHGLPLEKTARPPVHRYACSAVHSAREVGFDSANTAGRSFTAAIASSTSRVKSWGWPDRPSSAVGRSSRTASASAAIWGRSSE